jgi:hypothetical protein
MAIHDIIKIVEVGVDPYGRGKPTVFYKDMSISETEMFYLWCEHWPKDWPELSNHTTMYKNVDEK